MTFTNIQEFNADLTRFSKTLTETQFIRILRKIGLQLLRAIVMRTPVDTGRARANWQVTINTDSIESASDSTDKSGGSTISKGSSVLGVLRNMSINQIQSIFISNNVEYIVDLENGHSGQAPRGMVYLSVRQIAEQF